ncbi:MAG: exopolysaccharide biosynthesis protein [Alphaproteobacteria bacterium]|nr:exopolysaccharide biosynthesis protein [Alphaproteobacteria bacterium]
METRTLTELLDDLKSHITGDTISLKTLLEGFHERGFGFFLFLFALPAALPFPAFGLHAIIALPLLLLSGQQALGFHTIKIPQKWENKTVSRNQVEGFITMAKPWIKRIEFFIRPRLSFITQGYISNLIGVFGFIMALSVAVPIPLTNTVPSFGIAMMAIGVLMRDGLAVIAGAIIGLTWVILLLGFVIIYGPEGFDIVKNFIEGFFQ